MILITGASGNAGGQVLQQVIANGQPAKAMYRSPKDAAGAPRGVETVIADFADRTALDRALVGVDKVYLVCAPVPQLVELESNAIEASKRAGVKHLVLNSSMGAGTFDSSFPRWHAQVEKVLQQSGVPNTVIRPNSFMQNILTYFAGTIRTQGAFYASMGTARVSFIDTRDIGAFVAKIFSRPGHEGKIYELNGPEAPTYQDVAAEISRATGKAVKYVDLPVAQLRQSMLDSGMPDWQVEALLELQRYYTEGGGGEVDDVVARVVGKQPVRLAQFVREFAGALVEQAQPA